MSDSIRILINGPEDGPTNMGRDQALLDRVGRGDSPPTLRFYRWSPATISLGYFQPYAEYAALPPPLGGLPVVRRVTGGGAIVHDAELTYALVLPRGHRLAAGNPACLYDSVHAAIIAASRDFEVAARRRSECGADTGGLRDGAFLCFARRHATDIVVEDEKLAGSAQRRTRDAVLQHGSIILDHRLDAQPSAALGPTVDVSRLIDGIARHLATDGQTTFTRAQWRAGELEAATAHSARFRDAAWTKRR